MKILALIFMLMAILGMVFDQVAVTLFSLVWLAIVLAAERYFYLEHGKHRLTAACCPATTQELLDKHQCECTGR